MWNIALVTSSVRVTPDLQPAKRRSFDSITRVTLPLAIHQPAREGSVVARDGGQVPVLLGDPSDEETTDPFIVVGPLGCLGR